MNKNRVESFTDNIFAFVMTLLVINVRVPIVAAPVTNGALWAQVAVLLPTFGIYIMTFIVLSSLWMNHHFLFSSFKETLNRQLTLLNLLYLLFIVFLPFSADFIGIYGTYRLPVVLYGLNLLCISLISMIMILYIRRSPEIDNHEWTPRVRNQVRFRSFLSLASFVVGIICGFMFIPASIFFYTFPVIFNIIPGTLNLAEKMFKFKLE